MSETPLPVISPPLNTSRNRSWLGFGPVELLLLLVAAVWGGSYTATKLATQQLPVLEFLVLRFGLTFLVLLPALRPLRQLPRRPALRGALLLGANLFAILLCETFGVSLTTASNAAFLISLCVAFTPFCEWWLLDERPTLNVMSAATLSLVGAGLLAFQNGGNAQLAWGDGLMVLAAFLRGVMVCLMRRHGQKHHLPALTMTAIQMGVMALGALALLLWVQGPTFHPLPVHPGFWSIMAFLVLMCTVLAFFAQNYAVARTSPSRVVLLMGSEPLFGALIAVLWMGDAMTAMGWLGGFLIVGSAWWVTRPAQAARRPL